jgi:hypothetical protein
MSGRGEPWRTILRTSPFFNDSFSDLEGSLVQLNFKEFVLKKGLEKE